MLVVVGGHSRNIGKTSVVCGIISALPEWNWTAIKITQFGHGLCSRNGEPCPCENPTHRFAISQEEGDSPTSDSGRFLTSGAQRAFWVRTPMGGIEEALPRVRKLIEASPNVIIESNSLLGFVDPDFYIVVVSGAVIDFKPTSLRYLDRTDALVKTSPAPLEWPDVEPARLRDKPVFEAPPPDFANPDLIAAIRSTESRLKSQRPRS